MSRLASGEKGQVRSLPTAPHTTQGGGSLRVLPVGRAGAQHAATHWHYAQVMPAGKVATCGVWEANRYIGAIIFGQGSTPDVFSWLGLSMTQCVELSRVALRDHQAPVSQIVTAAIRVLRAGSPGLRCVVSYADPMQGHHGGIYQAMNWVYTGRGGEGGYISVNGKLVHARSLSAKYGGNGIGYLRQILGPNVHNQPVPGKHRYVLPLDRAMRRQVAPFAQPYPERTTRGT